MITMPCSSAPLPTKNSALPLGRVLINPVQRSTTFDAVIYPTDPARGNLLHDDSSQPSRMVCPLKHSSHRQNIFLPTNVDLNIRLNSNRAKDFKTQITNRRGPTQEEPVRLSAFGTFPWSEFVEKWTRMKILCKRITMYPYHTPLHAKLLLAYL